MSQDFRTSMDTEGCSCTDPGGGRYWDAKMPGSRYKWCDGLEPHFIPFMCSSTALCCYIKAIHK